MEPEIIDYPSVTIGAQSIPLKFTCRAIIELQRRYGFNLFNLPKSDTPAEIAERTFALLSVGIMHTTAISADELAAQYEYSDLPQFTGPIAESLKKAVAQGIQSGALAPLK